MRPEDQVQKSIIAYLAAVAPTTFVYAVPNGSRRTASGRATNAVPGIVNGWPDLGLVLPDGRAAFIECKSAKGVLSKAQRAVRMRLIKVGIPCCVARSVEDARAALAQWGVATREAKNERAAA